jgi:hypothetical protein
MQNRDIEKLKTTRDLSQTENPGFMPSCGPEDAGVFEEQSSSGSTVL